MSLKLAGTNKYLSENIINTVCTVFIQQSGEIVSKRDYYDVLGVNRDASEQDKKGLSQASYEISPG